MIDTKGLKDFPDAERQEMMWRVAVSSAIETAEPAHQIFARLLHHYLKDAPSPGREASETHNKTVQNKSAQIQ